MELKEVLSQGAYMLLYSRYCFDCVGEANALSLSLTDYSEICVPYFSILTALCLNDDAFEFRLTCLF